MREFSLRRGVALAVLGVFALNATGCQTAAQGVSSNPKTVLGSLAGAGAGAGLAALAGGSAGWIVGGAAIGGLLGGVLGNQMDEQDRIKAQLASQQAFESNRTGQQSSWNNPDSGNSGTVTPTRTYQNASGQYCREFQQEVKIGMESHQAYGTACRQPDGSWKIQS